MISGTLSPVITIILLLNSCSTIEGRVWRLQEPNGKSPASGLLTYSDKYFYFDTQDGSLNFLVPHHGTTTKHSLHVRCELREFTPEGKPAAWVLDQAPTLHFSGMVTLLGGGPRGRTTLAQVFDASADKPLAELEFRATRWTNQFQLCLMVKHSPQGKHSTFYVLGPAHLRERYTITLSLHHESLVVSLGSHQEAFPIEASFKKDQFYFKVGNYDQTTSKGTPGVLYTQVKVYSLTLS